MIIHIELKVKMGTERYYVSFVNTNKELTETEVWTIVNKVDRKNRKIK